jgi:hypothetical protein
MRRIRDVFVFAGAFFEFVAREDEGLAGLDGERAFRFEDTTREASPNGDGR